MIEWASRWLVWIAIRLGITMACLFTIKNTLELEDFRIEWRSLLVITICLIISIRFWSANPDRKEK
jgi:hypothetical protein